MKYTVLYAHNEKVYVHLGDIVKTGDVIAKMGATGFVTGEHVHLAVAEGQHHDLNDMRLSMLNSGQTVPSKQQCDYFVMDDLCVGGITITTHYLEDEYRNMFGQNHPAYDVVVNSTDKRYQWNRSWNGKVVALGSDSAYGNYVMIEYETSKASNNSEVGSKLFLPASANSWRVYPLDKLPVKGNECGFLNPSKFGGLEYEILGWTQTDVAMIQTRDFGKVQIYVASNTGAIVQS